MLLVRVQSGGFLSLGYPVSQTYGPQFGVTRVRHRILGSKPKRDHALHAPLLLPSKCCVYVAHHVLALDSQSGPS